MVAPPHAAPSMNKRSTGRTLLTVGALGVVFGDIGTSPLYTMREVFAGAHSFAPTQAHVYGVLSMIFWSLMIIVTLKYVLFIMRMDNNGEGGIMALISLVQRSGLGRASTGVGLVLVGIFGASLFYGDGMITPAISVLSAVEGLTVAAPALEDLVIPAALVILTLLFAAQRFGTGRVASIFGPVMLGWFTILGVLGAAQVISDLSILRSLSPHYAAQFVSEDPRLAFLALASVVLAVTGAEALYADMGHFGRSPIARAWLIIALPALLLNYMGQGALIVSNSEHVDNPFYRLAPDWAQFPLVLLATGAAVIAAQAVITGAFSVTRQAIQLGFLPRLTMRHTSDREEGQIYFPLINWGLFLAVVGLVVGFRSSSHMASAYGIAVTATLAIDTILAAVVVRVVWKRSRALAITIAVLLLTVDLTFFAANTTKILHGGWFPIVIALIVFTLLSTWRRGRQVALAKMAAEDVHTGDFFQGIALKPPDRVPGTAVYLTALSDGMPRPLVFNLHHNHVLHEHVVLFTSITRRVPFVSDEKRLTITELGLGIVRVVAAYGFMQQPDVPAALRLARDVGKLPIDADGASYLLSSTTLNVTDEPGLARWRKRLFALMSRNSMHAAQFLRVPTHQLIEIATPIDI